MHEGVEGFGEMEMDGEGDGGMRGVSGYEEMGMYRLGEVE